MRSPRNATALVGEKHTFHCEVTGNPKPTVRWERLDRALESRGHNYRVLKGGKLRLTRLLMSNRGYYRCLAENRDGIIRSNYVFLDVQGEAGRAVWMFVKMSRFC